MSKSDLKFKLIVPSNAIKLGESLEKHLQEMFMTQEKFIVRPNLIRFNNGEGKCVIDEDVSFEDIFILADVSNYSLKYKLPRRIINHTSPDDQVMDIFRIISSLNNEVNSINVIVPYMYQGRQDKRNHYYESLDLEMFFSILESLNVRRIITVDVHNPAVCNNIKGNMAFSNLYCSDNLVLKILENEGLVTGKIMVASPDFGALERTKSVANLLDDVPLGVFCKQRDYGIVTDGLNPVLRHDFLYSGSVKDMDIIISDDMIATGTSILKSAEILKEKGANKIVLSPTFGLFTNGGDIFNEYYEQNVIDRVYATNFSYIPDEIRNAEWFREVDCSQRLAKLLYRMTNNESFTELLYNDSLNHEKIKKLLKRN